MADRAFDGLIRNAVHLARVHVILSETYTDEGVFLYLTSGNHHLDGSRPIDLIAAGEGDRVLAVVKAIEGVPDAGEEKP